MDLHYMFPEINHENSWQKKKKKKLKQSEEKVKFVAKIKKKNIRHVSVAKFSEFKKGRRYSYPLRI